MECQFGNIVFISKFDSGNLARVEKVEFNHDNSQNPSSATLAAAALAGTPIAPSVADPPSTDYEFNVWTRPDCAGTPFENGNRTWFYFGVRGGGVGKTIKINVMNLNRQGKLYSQGFMPMVRTIPGRTKWERIKEKPTFENVDSNFVLSFVHRFTDFKTSTTYFAFAYPWTYNACQERLRNLEQKFDYCLSPDSKSEISKKKIYFHRELLCYSLSGHRVDLVTISDYHGIRGEEPRFDPKLFPEKDKPRCRAFQGKKIFFVSSRVHPGETPASFVFNGFLDFVLRVTDPRSEQLRKQFVFKLIPILNPDGVINGHYRTDLRGVNLNRVYLDPTFELYPSIYGAKSVLVYHHVHNRSWLTGDPSCSEKKTSSEVSVNTEPDEREKQLPLALDFLRDTSIIVRHEDSQASSSGSNTDTFHTAREKNSDISLHLSALYQDGHKMRANSEYNPRANVESEQIEMNDLAERLTGFQDEPCLFSNSKSQFAVETSDDIPSDNRIAVDSFGDIPSGGEYGDFDDRHLGNEGSDDDDENSPNVIEGLTTPHLSDPKLREIPSIDSGVAFYIDLHGHASKRGCFVYGNYFEDEENQTESMMYARLIALNSAHFDYQACNFTEKNMYTADKKDGSTKEGSGRVSVFKALGIVHSYTLECNYNTGRHVNSLPPASLDHGRATPPPAVGFPPKYTPAHFEDVGRAVAVAALDLTDSNPWTRLTLSEYTCSTGLRENIRKYIRSIRNFNKPPMTRLLRPSLSKSNSTTNPPMQVSTRMGCLNSKLSSNNPVPQTESSAVNSNKNPGAVIPKKTSISMLKSETVPIHGARRSSFLREQQQRFACVGVSVTEDSVDGMQLLSMAPSQKHSPMSAPTMSTQSVSFNSEFDNITRGISEELFLKSSSTSDISRRRLQHSFLPAGGNLSLNNDATDGNAHTTTSKGGFLTAELLEQRLSQVTNTSANQSHILLNSPPTLPNVRKYVQTRLGKHSSPIVDLSLASQANRRELFQVQSNKSPNLKTTKNSQKFQPANKKPELAIQNYRWPLHGQDNQAPHSGVVAPKAGEDNRMTFADKSSATSTSSVKVPTTSKGTLTKDFQLKTFPDISNSGPRARHRMLGTNNVFPSYKALTIKNQELLQNVLSKWKTGGATIAADKK